MMLFLLTAASGASTARAQVSISVRPDLSGTTGKGTVTSSPAGIACTLFDADGVPGTSGTCSMSFATGTVVTLTAAPAPNVTFIGWSGAPCGGTGNTCVLTANAATSVAVTFRPATSFQLSVTLQGNGYGTVGQVDFRGSPKIACAIPGGAYQTKTCTATYPATTTAKLEISGSLTMAGDMTFSGICTGTNICVIPMDGDRSVSAIFRAPAIVIGPATGNGSGRVTSNLGSISCDVGPGTATGACFATYPATTLQNIDLTAQANPGSTFGGWSVSDRTCPGTGMCRITTPAFYQPGTVVSPRFTVAQNSISLSGSGSGTVKSTPNGINCTLTVGTPSGACDVNFSPNASLTLTATPATGWQFASWGGACAGKTTNTCDVQLSQDQQVTVTFTRTLVTLTVAGGGNGDGTVASSSPAGTINCAITSTNTGTTGCSAQVPFETNVTLAATPATNSTFESWSLGSCAGTGPCVVALTTSQTVTATFKGTRVTVTVAGLGTGDGLVTAADGMSCRITKGVAATSGCQTSATPGGNAGLTAVPQLGSVFGGWSVASCAATALTCAVPVTGPASVSARFNAPPAAAQLIDALLGSGPKLSADQETELDKFGNNDKTFNLGDLIALLDRNNESISAATLARLTEAERKRPRLTSARRGAP
jgi:hypothetical protein